ncbi:MAG TPA: DUF3108 domain-containing protein [Candidatus Krumholzibacteria bacterium]|nr:DUF3108 domain-containing protein [Candidatus Krumholzibacteria bacterium]
MRTKRAAKTRLATLLFASVCLLAGLTRLSWADPGFGPGEEAVFNISYGVISAGEGTLSVMPYLDYDGSHCYHFRTRARSNRFFSAIFRVRDQADSFMDSDSLVTRYFNKHLREGSFRRDVEIHFDQKHNKAYFPDGRVNEIAPDTQDVLSAFFKVRAMKLEVGMEFDVPTHGDKEMYPLKVKVLRRETIDNDALGKIDCVVVQPFLADDGLFKHEGDLLLWMSDDERHIPVRMRANVPVGAIEANLISYTPPSSPAADGK